MTQISKCLFYMLSIHVTKDIIYLRNIYIKHTENKSFTVKPFFLGSLLCKRCIGNKTLVTWGNRRCLTAVRQRYISSPEMAAHAHKDLANIFMEECNTRNPFVNYDDLTMVTEDIDRLHSPQPLVYNDVMYNLRKLHELWFHLLKSG